MIAQIIFEKVLVTPQDRYDEYIRILNSLNIDYESDRMAFVAITNARKLLELFPDTQMVRRLYEFANIISAEDAKLLQQQAIYEMNSSGGSISVASSHLMNVYKLAGEDPIISHSLAELMYKKAEKATNSIEFSASLDECINICTKLTKRNHTNSHPFHTILKALLLKLNKNLENGDTPSIERVIKKLKKLFQRQNNFSQMRNSY
jgi:hypothetical protein